MVNSLHNNGATFVAARSAVFSMAANDYLEAKWAVSSTSGKLNSTAATSFSPAAPAVTMTITRIHGGILYEGCKKTNGALLSVIEAALEYSGGTHSFEDIQEGIEKALCSYGLPCVLSPKLWYI